MGINISKKVFNEAYLPLMDSDKRFKVVYGGSGSGKSVFIAQMLLYKMLSVKGCNILAVRAVDNTLRFSVFTLFKRLISEWKLTEHFKIRDTDMKIQCLLNGNELMCKGMNDSENIKSITFTTGNLTDIWIEEASEIDINDFRQLNLRLRGKDGVPKQIIVSFNPTSDQLWLKKTFFDEQRDDTVICKTTYKDNKFIDDEYAQQLEQLKKDDIVYWDVYCNGNWGVLDTTNVIIPIKLLLQAKTNKVDKLGEVIMGIDVARFGDDRSVIYYRYGNVVQEPTTIKSSSLVELSEIVLSLCRQIRANMPSYNITINVDGTGVGGGLVDILNSKKAGYLTINEINFSQRPSNTTKYDDITTEMMFNVKEVLTEECVCIPSHEQTISELSSRIYKITDKHKYKAESKSDFKKRLGKSPDYADAFMLMFYKPKNIIFC